MDSKSDLAEMHILHILNPYETKFSNQDSLWWRTFDFSLSCSIHNCEGFWIW